MLLGFLFVHMESKANWRRFTWFYLVLLKVLVIFTQFP